MCVFAFLAFGALSQQMYCRERERGKRGKRGDGVSRTQDAFRYGGTHRPAGAVEKDGAGLRHWKREMRSWIRVTDGGGGRYWGDGELGRRK